MKKLFSIVAMCMLIAVMTPVVSFAGSVDGCDGGADCTHEAKIGGGAL